MNKNRNFEMLFRGQDFSLANQDILLNEALFKNRDFRQKFPGSPHVDTEFIACRMTYDPPKGGDESALFDDYQANHMADLEAADTDDYLLLPNVYREVMGLAAYLCAERVGRVMVVRLKPGGHISAHKDAGFYHDYYDRFHIVLNGKGCHFRCGREVVKMLPGEVWWFYNNEEHEVWNDSDVPRGHIIVDFKLRGNKDVRHSIKPVGDAVSPSENKPSVDPV